jgi:hypothetical protein
MADDFDGKLIALLNALRELDIDAPVQEVQVRQVRDAANEVARSGINEANPEQSQDEMLLVAHILEELSPIMLANAREASILAPTITNMRENIEAAINEELSRRQQPRGTSRIRFAQGMFVFASLLGVAVYNAQAFWANLTKRAMDEHGWELARIFQQPIWGQRLQSGNQDSASARASWARNTAYLITAMRTGGKLAIDGEGRFYLPATGTNTETGMVVQPTQVPLSGGEIVFSAERIPVFRPANNVGDVPLPQDPVQLSAFLTAYFLEQEDTRVFLSWVGRDMITEAELLQMMSEIDDEQIRWILETAFKMHTEHKELYKKVSDGFHYATETASNLGGVIYRLPGEGVQTVGTAVSYPFSRVSEIAQRTFNPSAQEIYDFALKYPTVFWLFTMCSQYPRHAVVIFALSAWMLATPIRDVYSLTRSLLRYLFRRGSPNGRAPLAIEDAARNGRSGGGIKTNTIEAIFSLECLSSEKSIQKVFGKNAKEIFKDINKIHNRLKLQEMINKIKKILKNPIKSIKKRLTKRKSIKGGKTHKTRR